MEAFPDKSAIEEKISLTLEEINGASPLHDGGSVHYPGEGMKRNREESDRTGVFVRDDVWQKILALQR